MQVIEALNSVAVLLGILVAFYGIDSWRMEHSGKRKMELAEDALTLFYEAADAIGHIRHPAGFGSETESIERGEDETDAQFEARRNASIVFIRYQAYNELFSKLHAMRYRFMAQVGREQAKPFDDLRSINISIQGSARVLARLWQREEFVSNDQREKHYKSIEKHEAIFWSGLEENDAIAAELKNVIATIEGTCKGIIAGKRTLFGFINYKVWPRS